MPHLMRNHGDVAVSPLRFPGGIPRLRYAIKVEKVAAAPGIAVQVGIEHHVDAEIAGEVHVGVGQGRAVLGSAGEVEIRDAVTVAVVDVIGARLRQCVPLARGPASYDIDLIVRLFPPIVVQAGKGTAVHVLEIARRPGFGANVTEFAHDADPGLGACQFRRCRLGVDAGIHLGDVETWRLLIGFHPRPFHLQEPPPPGQQCLHRRQRGIGESQSGRFPVGKGQRVKRLSLTIRSITPDDVKPAGKGLVRSGWGRRRTSMPGAHGQNHQSEQQDTPRHMQPRFPNRWLVHRQILTTSTSAAHKGAA